MTESYQFDPLQHSIGIEQAPKLASWTWLHWLLSVAVGGVIIYGVVIATKTAKKSAPERLSEAGKSKEENTSKHDA